MNYHANNALYNFPTTLMVSLLVEVLEHEYQMIVLNKQAHLRLQLVDCFSCG